MDALHYYRKVVLKRYMRRAAWSFNTRIIVLFDLESSGNIFLAIYFIFNGLDLWYRNIIIFHIQFMAGALYLSYNLQGSQGVTSPRRF